MGANKRPGLASQWSLVRILPYFLLLRRWLSGVSQLHRAPSVRHGLTRVIFIYSILLLRHTQNSLGIKKSSSPAGTRGSVVLSKEDKKLSSDDCWLQCGAQGLCFCQPSKARTALWIRSDTTSQAARPWVSWQHPGSRVNLESPFPAQATSAMPA